MLSTEKGLTSWQLQTALVFLLPYLLEECLMGNDAPLFSKTKMIQGDEHGFKADVLTNEH